MTAAGLVLAAGEGRRLGRPKAVVELAGERLVDRAARAVRAGGCDLVVVVLGAAVVDVPEADIVIVNEGWASGMGSSLRAGLAAEPPGVGAVVVTLVDQPGIGDAAVRRLIDAYHRGATVAVATHGGRWRHPVLLAKAHWDEVSRLAEGDVGARPFLSAHAGAVVNVPATMWPTRRTSTLSKTWLAGHDRSTEPATCMLNHAAVSWGGVQRGI